MNKSTGEQHMTKEEFSSLTRGDIVRNSSGQSYVIEAAYGKWFIGVRTVTVTNHLEWEKVSRLRELTDVK